jgi:hypothetical protein
MLRAAPRLRPIAVLRQIYKNHPEIGQGVRRTIERRIRHWQNVNDRHPSEFLRSAHQGILELLGEQGMTHYDAVSRINRRAK